MTHGAESWAVSLFSHPMFSRHPAYPPILGLYGVVDTWSGFLLCDITGLNTWQEFGRTLHLVDSRLERSALISYIPLQSTRQSGAVLSIFRLC